MYIFVLSETPVIHLSLQVTLRMSHPEPHALFSELMCNCAENGKSTGTLVLQAIVFFIAIVHAFIFGKKEFLKRRNKGQNGNSSDLGNASIFLKSLSKQ